MNESQPCPVCGAEPDNPCLFGWPQPARPPGRRPVHAARYAMTLPESERGEFWEGRIDKWLRANGIDEGSESG